MAYVRLNDLASAFPPPRAASGLGQAAGDVEVVADERLKPWLTDPAKAPEAEVAGLLLALEALKDDADDVLADLRPEERAILGLRNGIAERRRAIAALQQAGMGEAILYERASGRPVDVADLSGFLDSARKAISNVGKSIRKSVIDPVKKIGRQVDKAVFQPVNENVFKPIDKAVFRPAGDAIQSAGRAVDKAVFRPITSSKPFEQAIKDPLKKVEKYTIRPAGKSIAEGVAFLDKTVPGWSTVIDVLMPIPISGIISNTTKVLVKGDVASRLIASAPVAGNSTLAQGVVASASSLAQAVVVPVAETAASAAAIPVVRQFSFTITKGTHTFLSTRGDIWQKLQTTALEALNGFALVVQLAAVAVSGGALAPAINVLNSMLTILKAGITVLKAQEAAKLLREQAKAIKRAAAEEAARLAAEDAALAEEIRRLEEQIAKIKRMREELAAQHRDLVRPRGVAELEEDEEPEVDEEALLVGAIAVVGGAIALAAWIRSRRD